MMLPRLKILFMHGLDSSRESTKFHAIQSDNKFCITIDYRNLNYETVADFYQNIVLTIKPDVLVGHNLGGYWALKLSSQFKLPAIVANPSVAPSFREDYPALALQELDNDNPKIAYLELGDETLDMYEIKNLLEDYMLVDAIEGGHHRLEHPAKLNTLIEHIKNEYFQPLR
ncbi:YqiA/YcfP family alpha/beta fold hydrolase [Acinetobacter soli]|uniref:YqiA/YcfP family alpha/beta fold hydrolase n=1 Tax=Acinetobacter soli TaxID=487316 RepID=UPI003AA8F79C